MSGVVRLVRFRFLKLRVLVFGVFRKLFVLEDFVFKCFRIRFVWVVSEFGFFVG